MISVRTLTKSYRNGFSRSVVLRRVDLEVEEGGTIVQVPPSEKQACYGDRIVDLADGRVVDDYPVQAETTAESAVKG